jgi:tetratricopeptide (TPR) repeat protein
MVLWGSSAPLIEGTRALESGRYHWGAQRLEQALRDRLPPYERAVALANLCAAYTALGLGDAALERCAEAIDADASNWRSFSNRGVVLLGRGRFEEAIADFRAALRMEPSAEPAQLGLQRALARSAGPPRERDI